MRAMVIFAVLLVLMVSGCTSYDSCMKDCKKLHQDDYNAVQYECHDNPDDSEVSLNLDLGCNSEAYYYVLDICYEECRGV